MALYVYKAGNLGPSSPLEHPGDTQVLVDVRPVDAHRHDLVILPLGSGGAQEPRIPGERRGDAAAIGQRHHEFGRGELDRTGAQVGGVWHGLSPSCPA